jgi:hypothetical protein
MIDLANLPPRLPRGDVPAYLVQRHGIQVRPTTLAKWAVLRLGPPFDRVGSRAYYSIEALDAWARSRLSPSVRLKENAA